MPASGHVGLPRGLCKRERGKWAGGTSLDTTGGHCIKTSEAEAEVVVGTCLAVRRGNSQSATLATAVCHSPRVCLLCIRHRHRREASD